MGEALRLSAMSWPIPEDEDERMSTLRSLELLDTPRHQEFERITALCGTALNVPICLVSLVDERRQWFLSNRGLGDTRETGRENRVLRAQHNARRRDARAQGDHGRARRVGGRPLQGL